MRRKRTAVVAVVAAVLAIVLLQALLLCPEVAEEQGEDAVPESDTALIVEGTARERIEDRSVFPIWSVKADTYFRQEKPERVLSIYDTGSLHLVYGSEDEGVTLDELLDIVAGNEGIPASFKVRTSEFCRALVTRYPEAELRPFRDNLRTLRICEVSREELSRISKESSLGCYSVADNAMYLPKGYTYTKGEWQYEVFFHEMSHCARIREYSEGGLRVKIRPEGPSFNKSTTCEALNSLFAISLLDYKETNITYQLQSNYVSVMLECLDNYTLTDYMNHSTSYFVEKLDEANGDKNYAAVILSLMQRQYEDYHGMEHGASGPETTDVFEVDGKKYWAILDYLSAMYCRKHLHAGMSEAERRGVADALVSKIMLNTPEEYNIDCDRIRSDVGECWASMGLKERVISGVAGFGIEI